MATLALSNRLDGMTTLSIMVGVATGVIGEMTAGVVGAVVGVVMDSEGNSDVG